MSDTVQCSECGLSADELQRTAAIRCPACVRTFRTELFLLRRRMGVQGVYAGRIPGERGTEHASLHEELSLAIDRDDFEQAVVIREKLKLLNSRSNS
ncbi:MAG: hypothetical protein KKI09_06920 [Spirochaetes bacterium]|nr:hypothetical protein [Spirochaetota bacterium]